MAAGHAGGVCLVMFWYVEIQTKGENNCVQENEYNIFIFNDIILDISNS